MTTENEEKYSYEDFIGSNAAFSFLASSFSTECLQAFSDGLDMVLETDTGVDDIFINIRDMCCNEMETLKNVKLSLFKFMNPDDIKHYDDFMEGIDEKIKKMESKVTENE